MAALTLLRCHLIWATSVSHRQVLSPEWSCFLKQAGLDHSLGSGYCTYWGGLTRLATQAIFSLPSPRCFGSKSACLPQKWSIGFLQPQGGSSSLCKTSWPGLPVSGPNCSSPHCPHNLPFHELAQMAKRLPAMRETWVLSLGWEDPLEKEMTTHSSTVAWKIPWAEEPGRLQSMGSLESDTTERLHFHFSLSCIGEGNGNPLQCSCLENPRDGGAWWAAVCGVTRSRTRLKQLSRHAEAEWQNHGLRLVFMRVLGRPLKLRAVYKLNFMWLSLVACFHNFLWI